jgi:hypothetical protein
MTITFENDNDVVLYALEQVTAFARRTQQIFLAQCVWWIASVIGLEPGLKIHVNNLASRKPTEQEQLPQQIVPGIVRQNSGRWSVSVVPRDLTEHQCLDLILESAEQVIQESFRDRSLVHGNRVNPLPTTKAQLRKGRKVKRLQEARDLTEINR